MLEKLLAVGLKAVVLYGVGRAVLGGRYDKGLPGGEGKIYSESQR